MTKIAAIRTRAAETAERVRSTHPRIYSRALVDVILEQPYCRIASLTRARIAERQTASRYLKLLAEAGVLAEVRIGREN